MSQQLLMSTILILFVLSLCAATMFVKRSPGAVRSVKARLIVLTFAVAAFLFSLWVNFHPRGR